MTDESKTGLAAGTLDVRAAFVGLQLLAFARRWAPGPRGALFRCVIACEEGLINAGELRGVQRELALETGLSRALAIAVVAFERER